MTAICNVIQVTTPPVYDDIYQDYKYYSIVLNSIIRDIELFPLTEFKIEEVLEDFIEYHIRAISTIKGLKLLNRIYKN